MNHASSTPLDTEARRYLRHHALLESARQQSHTYLNQVWLQLNRILARELEGELKQNNWLELIASQSFQSESIVGLRWRSNSMQGGIILEVADVRHWTQVSGDHIVYTLSSPSSSVRSLLAERCSDLALEQSFAKANTAISLIRYGAESSRVFSLACPLRFSDPRQEAQAVLEAMAYLWELIESESDSNQSQSYEPQYSEAPRYASAAPPITPSNERVRPEKRDRPVPQRSLPRATESSAPGPAAFPPTLNPKPSLPPEEFSQESRQEEEGESSYMEPSHTQSTMPSQSQLPPRPPVQIDIENATLDEVEQAFAGMSKEEMIQAIQAQVRQRPGRLIRGGEKRSTPVLSEPPRFVPRPLKSDEGERVLSRSSSGEDSSDGRVYDPDQSVESIDLSQTNHQIKDSTAHVTSPDAQALSQASMLEQTLLAKDKATNAQQPSYIKPLSNDGAPVNPNSVIIKAPISEQDSQAISAETHQQTSEPNVDFEQLSAAINSGDENQASSPRFTEARELDAKTLGGMLERVGLPPWRVNSYDEGRGQILWLNNGAHIDYNPSGEVILGGENQDETRIRLSQIGIVL